MSQPSFSSESTIKDVTEIPKKNPAAKKIDRISHMEFIQQDLRAMDATAVTICMENKIPVLAFGLFEENSIVRAVEGQDIGTLIV